MKKKEVRWLSRDNYGDYKIWREKPCRNILGNYVALVSDMNFISYICTEYAERTIVLKKGGLAKVTIERQY